MAKKVVRNGVEFFGHPRFYELIDTLADLHSRKNHDYSGENDPLRNLKQCADMGIAPWKGVVVRLTDKMDRLKSYAKKGEFLVGDEGLLDTFRDMAIYSVLGMILYEEELVELEKSSKLNSVHQVVITDNPTPEAAQQTLPQDSDLE